MANYRERATFYRAALLLGLVPGEDVIAWVDGVIGKDADAPHAFLDVSLTPPGDLTALRHALLPLGNASESLAVVHAILGVTARDLNSGVRNIRDTITVIAQMRRMLAIGPDIEDTLDVFEDGFMLASAGATADAPHIERRVREWLAQFAGAEAALMDARPYHVVVCERAIEAAAFVAALSRFVNSPAAHNAPATHEPAEVWAAPRADGTGTTLYLNDAAFLAAQTAFSPVPVVDVCAADARPREATLVLDLRDHRAMGLIEAQRVVAGNA